MPQAKSSQRPSGLADIPLYGMQTVAAIGDVRGADVLAGRQQVIQVPRHECTQRDLEGLGGRGVHYVSGLAVDVDGVPAHTDAVAKRSGASIGLVRSGDLLLDNGLARFNAPGLADVGVLREAIGGPHDVGAQSQFGIAVARRRRATPQSVASTTIPSSVPWLLLSAALARRAARR